MNVQNPNPPKKKGCGCIAKGCVVMLILAVVFVGVLVWGGKRVISSLRSYASTTPVSVPAEAGTQDEYQALIKRLNDFKGGGKKLELTAHDINLLIAFSPEWSNLRGRIRADIDNDVIGLNGSLPLDGIGISGEYLNGQTHFTLSLDNKMVRASVKDLRVKDTDIQGDDLKKISSYWSAYLSSNLLPVLGPVFATAKTLKVSDGVIALGSE